MKIETVEPYDKKKARGMIMLEDLTEEEFFALMDDINNCLDMFRRWDDKKGVNI